jgi:hypothetical protein
MTRLALFLISVLFLSIGTWSPLCAYDLKPYAYPFIGKWNPTDDPLLLDDYGYQDIQNLRRDGKRLKGVRGHSRINEDEISGNSSFYRPRGGFHFTKDSPQESHVLIQAWDPTETSSAIYQNQTAIPNTGEFSGTTLHADASGAGSGRFSAAPGGAVAYANGQEAAIWGGDEMKVAGFYTKVFGQTPADQWEKVLTSDTDTYASLGGLTTFYVGSNRRINRVKLYVKTANTTAATLGVSEYVLSGATWASVAGQSDGTASGGAPIAATGTVSWTYNTDTRSTFVEDTDVLAYWYQFTLSSAASAGTALYYVTCAEGEFRPVEDLWDGNMIPPARVWYTTASGTTDFTTEMQEDSYLSYADLGTFSTTNSLVVGFTQKMRGIGIKFVSDHLNAVASGVTVHFHTGAAWSGVTGLYDGTKSGAATFGKNEGWIHWIPTEETTTQNIEARRTYQNNEPLYYYRITVSANLTANTWPFFIEGIPSQAATYEKKQTTRSANFPTLFQKRLWLFGGNGGIYSKLDAPDVFNGDDAGFLTFGGDQEITAAGTIYNVFLSTGYEQLIVTKTSETHRVHGTGPEDWAQEQISSNVGCVAPQSFAVCEVSDMQEGLKRNIAIWQASHGFVKCDGATVQDISDDIACYFNPSDSRSIAKHRIDNTVAWYDPYQMTYHALISSGAEINDTWGNADTWKDAPAQEWGVNWEESVTVHNLELEYSLKYNEWTKIYRADNQGARPLQVGFQVRDTEGKVYTYGASDNGVMYRLENGRTWDGTPIAQYVRTKDLIFDETKSLMNFTTVKNMRLMFKYKAAGSGETIQVTHYGDGGAATVSGVSNQKTVEDISMAVRTGRNSQDVNLGEFLKHSFKIDVTTSTVDEGMELIGLGLYYETLNRWME